MFGPIYPPNPAISIFGGDWGLLEGRGFATLVSERLSHQSLLFPHSQAVLWYLLIAWVGVAPAQGFACNEALHGTARQTPTLPFSTAMEDNIQTLDNKLIVILSKTTWRHDILPLAN
eukprot:5290687-Amphidinium_carterae.1